VNPFPKREAWRHLPRDSARELYFETLHAAVKEFYLDDPSNPYQQSGRSKGAERWEETRRCFVQAIDRSGDFLDVGCANGLFLESIMKWAGEVGFVLRPYGLDFVAELVELARKRFPEHKDSFFIANAFDWQPERQFDFVRTSLEYVPEQDWTEFVRRQYATVAPGGRLIVSHYRNAADPVVDVAKVVQDAGYVLSGRTEAPGVVAVWTDVAIVERWTPAAPPHGTGTFDT